MKNNRKTIGLVDNQVIGEISIPIAIDHIQEKVIRAALAEEQRYLGPIRVLGAILVVVLQILIAYYMRARRDIVAGEACLLSYVLDAVFDPVRDIRLL